jgi:predicted ArsR family transcriptional regulator
VTDAFAAAAEPTRRRILQLLARRPLFVTDLAANFDVTRSAISQHLGVLAEVHPQAALEVFEKDCLIYLGTCVAAKGNGKPGKPCFTYRINGKTLSESGTMHVGELKLT